MITVVPIGLHPYSQTIVGVGMCTHPWLASSVAVVASLRQGSPTINS
jgi:hypothetical protein